MRSKISYAVAAILGGASFGAAAAEPAAGTTEGGALEEIIVTAQKREQSIQDVPISMQALTGQALQQLNVSTFDDYIKFLPNVTTANNGPGQNEVFMRGLSAGSQASQGSGSTGAWPNVAIYLDNQSGQLPNRNLDIYAADLNRIEVLEGPQGTLFGAGAEAGVIRYITNEPKLDKVEASVKAGYGLTTHGDPNTDLTAVLNLPLIADKMAVRAVIYDDHRGGYIDNVPATFTRKSTDIGIHYAQYATACSTGTPSAGACPVGSTPTAFGVPPGSPSLNNNSLTARAINPVTYKGIRVEALYKFSDDWDVLFTQSYQDMQSEGVFYQQPNASDGAPLQTLQVTLFNNSYDKDKFESTAWTVNGRFAALKAVYTGGYLVRNVDQIGDYTNYARGVFADYYQCYGPAYDATLTPTCFSPSAIWHNVERNTHQQHEFRLSTPDDWRVRAIAGAYWEDNKLYDQTAWLYKNVPPCTVTLTHGCLTNVGPFAGTTVVNPGGQGDNTSFYQDQVRDTKQTAFFVSVDFDLIPKVLTATLGTRHFQFKNSMAGSVLSSFGCFEAGLPPCQSSFSFNLDAQNLRDTESGYKSRGNLTWHITPDVMWNTPSHRASPRAASWNQSEQKNSPTLIDLNPASGNFGNPITQVCDTSGANCVPLSQRGGNPYGAIGSPSANAPPIQFSFRARYDWSIGGYTPYVQFGATHSGHSFTQAGANPTFLPGQTVSNSRGRFENPAYSVYDASFGVAKDAWYLNFYAENLSNSNASVFVSTDQFIVAQTPLRPRVLGAAFGYKF